MTKQIFLRDESMMSDTIGRMRFILLFGVLMIHSRLTIDNNVDFSNFSTTELYKLCMYTGSLVIPSFCVPAFFLISGYLFFYKLDSFNLSLFRNKLQKRFKSLFIPYVLFCVIAAIAYLCIATIGGGNLCGLAKDYLTPSIFWDYYSSDGNTTIWGYTLKECYPTDAPLWYVRDLMVYCVLSPVIYLAAKYTKIAFLALLLIIYFTVLWPSSALFYYGFVFFSLGVLLSVNKMTLFIENRNLRFVVYALTVLMLLLRAGQVCETQFGTELIKNVYIMLATLSVFNLFGYNSTWKFPKWLTEPTFFVFATHQILLIGIVHNNILPKLFLNSQNPLCLIAEYMLTPFVTLFVCILTYYLIKRLLPSLAVVLNGNR